MSDISLSKGIRSNLLQLQNTADLIGRTQNRLATGKRVNSALDNPTNFFTASALNSRANDLSNLLDALGNGIKTLEAADNGLKAITKTVESMQATLRQARQDKSFKTSSYTVDSATIGTAAAKNISFSGGAVGTTAVNVQLNTVGVTTQSKVTASAAYTAPTAAVQSKVVASAAYTAPTAATKSTVTAANAFTDIDLTANADNTFTFDVTLGATTKTVTLDQAGSGGDNKYSIGEAVTAIQNQLTAGGVAVTVGQSGGKLTFTADTAGATALTIDNGAVNGTTPVATVGDLGISSLGTTGQTDTGAAAVDRVITIGNGTNTANITLTSANAGDAATARTYIASQLTAQSVTGVTVGGTGSNIDLTGAADGSNSITIGGAGANAVFGAGATTTAGATAVDRVITIGNGTNTANITLTSANAGDAATARTYITAQLAAQNVTNVTVGGAGNNIDLAGAADGSNSVTVGGAGADAVFGAGRTTVAGVTLGSVKSVDQLVTDINANTSLAGKIKASNDSGKLRIENLSTEGLTVGGIGTDGELDGSATTGTVGGNEVRKNLVGQFNELRTQLDKLSDDSSFNGINLLKGDKLKLNFNEIGTSSIEIQAKDTAGNVREISNTKLSITAVVTGEFSDDTTIDARLNVLSDALTTLRSQSSTFGSNLSVVQNRTEFTKSTINTLKTGADGLTLADQNEEAANLLSLQTRQQLASTALSLANQADQGVLRLF